jgi:hypothetical protein
VSFWTQALPYAQQAHAQTKVLVSVIMAQWADENGYHWPPPGNNPGNVGNPDHGGQTNYATITAGVNAYIHTMNLGYYTAVRNAVGYVDQSHALGQSPWAAAHYEGAGPPPGQDLIKIIEQNDLTQYDDAPAPIPVPPLPDIKEESVTSAFGPDGKLYVSASSAGTDASPEDNLLVFQIAPGNPPTISNVIDVTAGIEKAFTSIYKVQP